MKKKTDGLLFRIGLMFAVITIITLVMCGISTYYIQMKMYKDQCEVNVKSLAYYLEDLAEQDGEAFVAYTKFMTEYWNEVKVPLDFSDYSQAQEEFEKTFSEKYPGHHLGKDDIDYYDMSKDLKLLYTRWKHEYWTLVHEKAREDFNLPYTEYVVPTGEEGHIYFVVDSMRDPSEVFGDDYLNICINIENKAEDNHEHLWAAWENSESMDGFDVFDNEYGKDYAYYVPVIIDGATLGVIGAEVDIYDVNENIIKNTIQQLINLSIILIIMMAILLVLINKKYVSKIGDLSKNIRKYAENKDADISKIIEHNVQGGDEIASLSMQTAAMILELDNYMKSLVETTNELVTTKEKAAVLNELAVKDALTGVRNRTAYNAEAKKIDWKIQDGFTEFGIVMIDLNFLKRTNDMYGHDKGNIAIKNLCKLICTTYQHSPVFRIGGDEFVVIVENEDYRNVNELTKTFKSTLAELAKDVSLEPWESISAAAGVALFDPQYDNNTENVCKRADKAMYENKKAMKAVRME